MPEGTARPIARSRSAEAGRWLGWLLALVALAAIGGSLGCATLDPLHKRSDFDDLQKRFTQDLRWGRIDKASEIVAPDLRDEFKALAPDLSELHITDYQIVHSKLDPDLNHATVDVRYSGYRADELVERSVTIHEVWTRDEKTGDWHVKLDLDRLRSGLGIPVEARREPLAAH